MLVGGRCFFQGAFKDRVVVAQSLHAGRRVRRIRRAKRAWCWPRNRQRWFKNLLRRSYVDEWWKENFRISRKIFQCIVRLVGPDLAKEDTTMCKALSVEKRIAVALERLATAGDTCHLTTLQFDVGRTTALRTKQEFEEARYLTKQDIS